MWRYCLPMARRLVLVETIRKSYGEVEILTDGDVYFVDYGYDYENMIDNGIDEVDNYWTAKMLGMRW